MKPKVIFPPPPQLQITQEFFFFLPLHIFSSGNELIEKAKKNVENKERIKGLSRPLL